MGQNTERWWLCPRPPPYRPSPCPYFPPGGAIPAQPWRSHSTVAKVTNGWRQLHSSECSSSGRQSDSNEGGVVEQVDLIIPQRTGGALLCNTVIIKGQKKREGTNNPPTSTSDPPTPPNSPTPPPLDVRKMRGGLLLPQPAVQRLASRGSPWYSFNFQPNEKLLRL